MLDPPGNFHPVGHLSKVTFVTDTEREIKIQRAASGIEAAMHCWEQSGNFADRGRADRYRLEMEDLIRGRGPDQVARMEAQRGLL